MWSDPIWNLSNVFRDAYKNCHESKDLKQVTDSSKYLKSVLVQGMADKNAVNESWGCISEEYSTMADTLKAIYRWVGTDFVRDEYARLASEEV